MVALKAPDSSTPSRLNVEKPGSVNVTLYVPDLRSTMRYWPVLSVTTDRTRSISAGLAASTVTPGSTAPEVSLAVPVMVAWAHTAVGTMSRESQTVAVVHTRRIPFVQWYIQRSPRHGVVACSRAGFAETTDPHLPAAEAKSSTRRDGASRDAQEAGRGEVYYHRRRRSAGVIRRRVRMRKTVRQESV